MNAHRLRSLTRRYNFGALLVALLSTIVFAYGVMSGAAQSPANQGGGAGGNIQSHANLAKSTQGEDIKQDFNEDDLKVKEKKARGRWATGLVADMGQFNDPSAPVVVAGIQSLSGAGKYMGVVKIKRVVIKNKGSRIVSSVQLRWTVASFDNEAKVLSEDTTHFVNTWVEPNSSQRVEIPALYPGLMLKSVAKDGELNGEFTITIGVQEARFADGSSWRRPSPVAYLKFLYLDTAFDGFFPTLASIAPAIPPPLPGSSNSRIRIAPCEEQSRSTASAFSFMLFQIESCRDDMGPLIDDETGKQSCGRPVPGMACYSNCSADGWCTVDSVPGAKCNPTPTPPPPDCPQQLYPCCEKEIGVFPGAQGEQCRWNCNPDKCPPGTTFTDGCFSTGGPVVCPDGYTFVARHPSGAACCPVAPTPTPTPAAQGMEGYGGTAFCGIDLPPSCMDGIDNDGDGLTDGGDPGCVCPSPVLVDTRGDGFSLTGASAGVLFDIAATGRPLRLSWTPAGSDDAWLALDRDGDGLIGNGRELFGNYTEQPPSPGPNGFLALALFDRAERGGNSDGLIDSRDSVFASLRLWRDADHDGVSRPSELFTLQSLDVARLRLSYKESRRVDEHGNRFRYRAQVEDAKGARVGRWAWDVFLVAGP